MLPRTVVDKKLTNPNEQRNEYIDFVRRPSYFVVKCVIIGHCFRHNLTNRDTKRLRITGHSLRNDAGYNPGNTVRSEGRSALGYGTVQLNCDRQ